MDEGDWSWGHKAACKVAKACSVDGGGQLPSSSAQVCTCTKIIIIIIIIIITIIIIIIKITGVPADS